MSSHHEVSGHRMQYILAITREMFGFSVSRTHEAASTIFNTTMEGLILSDQLLQLNMELSSRFDPKLKFVRSLVRRHIISRQPCLLSVVN